MADGLGLPLPPKGLWGPSLTLASVIVVRVRQTKMIFCRLKLDLANIIGVSSAWFFALAWVGALPSDEPSLGLGQCQHFHFPESARIATRTG